MIYSRVILFLFLLGLTFLPFSTWLGSQALLSTLFDLLHFPAAFILTLFFLNKKDKIKTEVKLLTLSMLIMCIEILQFFSGRDASLMDMIWGWLGLFSAWIYLKLSGSIYKNIIFTPYVFSVLIELMYISIPHLTFPVLTRADNYIDHILFENVNEIKERMPSIVSSGSNYNKSIEGYKLDYPWSGLSYKFIIPIKLNDTSKLEFDFYSKTSFENLDVALTDDIDKKVKSIPIVKTGWQHYSINVTELFGKEKIKLSRVSIYFETSKGPDKYMVDNLVFK